MGARLAYLRIAHPPGPWGADDAALALDELARDRKAWSLYIGDGAPPSVDPTFSGLVLAGFYGWRSGKVPLSAVGYVAFDPDELKAVSGGQLISSPHECTFRWPPELIEAHWDLKDHTEEGVRALARAMPLRQRLQRVERVTLYVEQLRLLQREDCHQDYRNLVLARIAELHRKERPVLEQLRAACRQTGITFSFP